MTTAIHRFHDSIAALANRVANTPLVTIIITPVTERVIEHVKSSTPAQLSYVAPCLALFTAGILDGVLGRMTGNLFTWLPLAAPHTVLTRQITSPQPGFLLYNISDGVVTQDLAGWFTRWLSNPNLHLSWASTTVDVRIAERVGTRDAIRDPVSKSVQAQLFIILCGILLFQDSNPFEICHAFSMVATACMYPLALSKFSKHVKRLLADYEDPAERVRHPHNQEPIKALIQLPTGRIVRLQTTRGLLFVLLDQERTEVYPTSSRTTLMAYKLFAWTTIIFQAVTLGLSSQSYQLVIVALMSLFTAAAYYGVLENTFDIALTDLEVWARRQDGPDTNRDTYARLRLTIDEEQRMRAWNLFPTLNMGWEERYAQSKRQLAADEHKRVVGLGANLDWDLEIDGEDIYANDPTATELPVSKLRSEIAQKATGKGAGEVDGDGSLI